MEELTPITRREVFLAKASGQEVETPTPVTREEVFLDEIAKGGGGGGSSLPSVTSADDGKVLAVKDGAWAASEQGKKFIVTLTPYDETFSGGQMDKTVGEIKQAVDAGMEVWFQVTLNENLTGLYVCNGIEHYPNAAYEYVFIAMFVLSFANMDFLCKVFTFSASEDNANWVGKIFTLTPAS